MALGISGDGNNAVPDELVGARNPATTPKLPKPGSAIKPPKVTVKKR